MLENIQNNDSLVWHEWTTDKSIPDNLPFDEYLLVETTSRICKLAVSHFYKNEKGSIFGIVGSHFYYDYEIIRWTSIQHLLHFSPRAK